MDKPRFVISCPFDTYSGYGARSRDLVKAIIELDKYKIELLPQRWGGTPWGFCKDHPEWQFLLNYTAKNDWNKTQPEIWMQITIPNEFQPLGKYNIGVTAGIESNVCKVEWLEGLNRMNENWVSSNHAKNTFVETKYSRQNKQTGQNEGEIKLEKPIKVVFEGANLDVYKNIPPKEIKNIDLSFIKESFCFLFVGHWMQGEFGHDRKNVSLLVKAFFETFKNVKNPPALILKSSTGTSSYMSREELLNRILRIRRTVNSHKLPNIYLLNGDLSDNEVNELYNHPKVKAMVSLTKGEGYGRPLLEFSLTGKPIIASGWSGHMDFLHNEYTLLLPGELENVHTSAANDWLIKESKWFKPSDPHIGSTFKEVFKNYKKIFKISIKQKYHAKNNFSYKNMKDLISGILEESIPEFPKQVELNMPKISLPELKKIE
jgi:hypothetical protein